MMALISKWECKLYHCYIDLEVPMSDGDYYTEWGVLVDEDELREYAAKALGGVGLSQDDQLKFTKDNGLDYMWSDDVCVLLGELIGDYKNAPEYVE